VLEVLGLGLVVGPGSGRIGVVRGPHARGGPPGGARGGE
jgi:hypothetical protein